MQKARRHSTKELRPLAGTWFQSLFTPIHWVLFTFPSRYWFTIGLKPYLALPDGAGRFNPGVSDPDLLRIPSQCFSLHLPGSHRLWPAFPRRSIWQKHLVEGPTTPDGP